MLSRFEFPGIRLITSTAICLLFLAVLATAQQIVDETRKADADARIMIDNLSGSITLKGWDREEVKITGTLGKGTERLEIKGDADNLHIEVILPRRARNIDPSDLAIMVPVRSRVHVGTVNADVDVEDFAGRIHVDTVNGDVEVAGELQEIEVETVSGDVNLLTRCDDLEVSSVSGDIRLDGVHGEAAVETVSGDVDVKAGSLRHFDFSTVSGDLDFRADPTENGDYSFSAQSGDINLMLPETLNAEFEISTFSGDIHNDIGPKAKKTSKWVPAQELHFILGEGSAQFEIETFSGDVNLRTR